MTDESPNLAADAASPAEGVLDAAEVRVLGVLAEKESLTPDNYPLSLNALTNGCNQLTSREPVMSLSEEAVQETLRRLMQKKLVAEVSQSGARVVKYEHRMRIRWALEQDKLAILTMLMLRGPQTAGEIRNRVGRMHEFASIEALETGLQFLMDKYPPVVARLTRMPGTKEARYAHLLSGDVPEQSAVAGPKSAPRSSDAPPAGDMARLEKEVAELRAQIEALTHQFDEWKRQFE